MSKIVCPDCGSSNIGKGKLSGYASMSPMERLLSLGSPIVAELCTDCGKIINMKVTKPHRFKK